MAVIFITAFVLRLSLLISHDISWLLYLTKNYIGGEKLYVDLVEVNPPLIFWLMSPAVWGAKTLGLSLSFAYKIYVFLLSIISLLLCSRYLQRLKIEASGLVLCLLAFVMTLLPAWNFGQREHLMVILCLPYLFLIMARRDKILVPSWLMLISVFLAVLAFCIKPYFVIVPASLEIYLLFSVGLRGVFRRPDPYLLVAGALAYVGLIFTLTPEYLSEVVSYAREVYTIGYNAEPLMVAKRAGAMLMAMACFGLLIVVKPIKWMNAFIAVMLVAAIGSVASYGLQMKGWDYHKIPATTMIFMAGVYICVVHFEFLQQQVYKKIAIIGLMASMALMGSTALTEMQNPNNHRRVWGEVIENYPGTDSFLIMSANVYQGFPLTTEENLIWASRFPCLWMLPGLQLKRRAISGTTPLLDEIDAYIKVSVAEDIERYKPELIIVDATKRKHHFADLNYDYIPDFLSQAEFAVQWKHYKKVDNLYGFDIYQRAEIAQP